MSIVPNLWFDGCAAAAALRAGRLQEVTGAHLSAALDDLLDSTQSVTRALLGVPADQSQPPMSAPLDRGHHGHGGAGWMSVASFGDGYDE